LTQIFEGDIHQMKPPNNQAKIFEERRIASPTQHQFKNLEDLKAHKISSSSLLQSHPGSDYSPRLGSGMSTGFPFAELPLGSDFSLFFHYAHSKWSKLSLSA
jgi:hypothetical protein